MQNGPWLYLRIWGSGDQQARFLWSWFLFRRQSKDISNFENVTQKNAVIYLILIAIDLMSTSTTNNSITHIIKNLKPTLEELDVSKTIMDFSKLIELKSLQKLWPSSLVRSPPSATEQTSVTNTKYL